MKGHEDLLDIILTGPNAGMTWLERFSSLYTVLPNGCWKWTGKLYPNGYGYFWMKGKEFLAHRVSFAIHNQCFIDDIVVRHSCDYRPCVNPDHLLSGTQQNNIDDAWDRNRYDLSKFGSGRRVIPKEDLHKIFEMRSSGMLQKDIAIQFNVRQNQISRILSGKRRTLLN